ncbi:fatty acid synthase-like [Hyposmocoma kahamanoa]|uniref:fatty acid synthase-like n=1 Tax=Hyposmocoma kahamanoa TaxID=1477025 RepID=UPI000E6D841A|nr:fatty acid synthase-like [Hyposmocoma kahamanoa]
MSGLFPQARHVKDLAEILYDKKNPISSEACRWKCKHPDISNFTGNIPGLLYFDAQFFKVHYRLGQCMDPMGRKILEMTYQAIYDAGINPQQLSGKKVGVYIGSCFSESEKASFYDAGTKTGFGIPGCCKSMFANRISYWLNAKGPSMSIDVACCSSFLALEQACQAITRGECDSAIVGGCNISLHPQSSFHYSRIVKLSPDGKTKSFDENADGCVRSEAINVLYLQKAKDAKRMYAEVVHIKNEFSHLLEGETGPQYGFNRDSRLLTDFIKTFYDEAKVPPHFVEYVEAFGSATPESDRSELEALEEVLCKNRQSPLLVGSIMSNIGYSEAASGISSVVKVLLSYQRGEIAANLHCKNPRRDIAALRNGKMEIVTEHKTFRRSYAAVNGISVTGINAHVLLKGYNKPKDLSRYKSSIPQLVTISARQDTSVQKIIDDLKSRSIDEEELALLRNIHQLSVSGHLGRGYSILSTNENGETISLAETVNYFDESKRPLWFVYSGMGSQWAGMGTQLMRIPIFAAAIERCSRVLKPKGVDIIHIITSEDKTIFDNILHSFVGIAAIQIGLTDILTALGLVPDNIIGHSVGELGCAYADGCFTAEEMILSAYSRGLVSVQTPFIRGSMAAVGLGYNQIKEMLPPEIGVACHNGPESSTISGPAEIMKTFVAELTAKGVFAKEVPCSNIAYHSQYIAEAGPGLLKYLNEVIKNPKPRSEKWLSTSVPEAKWNEPLAKYSSAEYHTNNLLNPVLFEETSQHVPANAVVVEIAPHGLLQAILKRSLQKSCKHIPLTRRGHPDNVFMVLDAIGKLYMEGFNSKVEFLYPKVEFPVTMGTPMLSHNVEWAHNEKWMVPFYADLRRKCAAAIDTVVAIHDDEHSYLSGHVIRGKNLYPFSAILVTVWDALAMILNVKPRSLNIQFNDVHLYAQPQLHDQRPLRLKVTLQRGSGRFEVTNDNRKVAHGVVRNTVTRDQLEVRKPFESEDKFEFKCDDVYKMLLERNYQYKDEFRSIHKVNSTLTEAQITWNNNWVTFLDGILQLHILRRSYDDTVCQPYLLRQLTFNINEHFDKVLTTDNKSVMLANIVDEKFTTQCGGVIIEGLQLRTLSVQDEGTTTLKALRFIPRFLSHNDISTAIEVYLQMVSEDISNDAIKAVGVFNSEKYSNVSKVISKIYDDIPGLIFNYEEIPGDKILEMRDYFLTDVDLVLVHNLSSDEKLRQTLYRVLPRNMFIISIEDSVANASPSALYCIVSTHDLNNTKIDLIKWRPLQATLATTVVTVRSELEFSILTSTYAKLPQKHKLVVISPYPTVPGLKDFVKDKRKDLDHNQIFLIMTSEKETLDHIPELELTYNVLKNGIWGGEYYTSWQENMPIMSGITLRSGTIGDLESLYWLEKAEPAEPGILVTVHYTAINNLDVMKATGMLTLFNENKSSDTSYCMDFSGVTDSGERVMGILPSGAASSRVKVRPEMLWPVPVHWSLEDAVTVPSAYLHAFYCYIKKIKLLPRYTILVHGGTGALGQAALAIALNNGCEVFTTVSDTRKKSFLMKLFPELQEDHIGNSRDHSFGDMVRTITKGKGCQIVISCVHGELKNASLKVSSSCGFTLDTAQISTGEEFNFGMNNLTCDRSYATVDLYSLFTNDTLKDLKKLQLMISEGIVKGYVRPLSRVTYPPHEASRAFRLLATSRHRGRVVLRLRDSVPVTQPGLSCSPDSCHIVVCDDDSFGVQFANTLVARGATKIHLHTQNVSSYLQMKKKLWANVDIKAEISSGDFGKSDNVVTLLSESNRLGPVEGVYVLASSITEQDVKKLTTLVHNLDWATRKFCKSLRYFAIVCFGVTVGQNTCHTRVRDGLPATTLNLCAFKKSGTEEYAQDSYTWRGALHTIERAICTSQSTLLALPSKKQTSLLQQISRRAKISISEDTQDEITLQDMGIELRKVSIIQTFLRDVFNIYLDDEEILNLTSLKIRELEDTITGNKFKSVRGLGTFFSYVDPDELLATNEWVSLPTRVDNGNMREDEFDVSKKYIFIIPGMEGHYARFQVLGERLMLSAIVLQPGLDLLHESIRETAERYAKFLLKKLEVKNNYYLLGYESGVSISLEVAAILEEHGVTGTVFCVGGTPEDIQATLLDQISEYETEEALQDAVAKHMYGLMSGNTEQLDQTLVNVSSWNEKIEAHVRTLLGKVPHSAQYARAWIKTAYTRIAQLRSYKVQPRQLRSKLILLRASLSTDLPSFEETTALMQRYSKQPVAMYQLQAPLAEATYDLRCGGIINRHLDDETQQAYKEANLCETYLVNPTKFIDCNDITSN